MLLLVLKAASRHRRMIYCILIKSKLMRRMLHGQGIQNKVLHSSMDVCDQPQALASASILLSVSNPSSATEFQCALKR
jgi:hypothetical protein